MSQQTCGTPQRNFGPTQCRTEQDPGNGRGQDRFGSARHRTEQQPAKPLPHSFSSAGHRTEVLPSLRNSRPPAAIELLEVRGHVATGLTSRNVNKLLSVDRAEQVNLGLSRNVVEQGLIAYRCCAEFE